MCKNWLETGGFCGQRACCRKGGEGCNWETEGDRFQKASWEVLINIRTLEVIQGNMPRRALGLVLEWAQEHRAELMENWELCTHNQLLKKIHPLP
ncbi:DUF4160 domain-containing protein [Acidithiobacillus sulfuriphilus]|uniref:DUF4160 domain-containing protein n=1 Tax=Acidithiobacillus sulfuriphilus TaxID=1867749 RepID=UPI003F600DB2